MASTGAEAAISNEMGDLDGDSLIMHRSGRPGKIEIVATKPLVTQRDLEARDLGDLLDTMIDGPDTPHERDDYTGFGTFTASGITVPLAVERFERGALEVLARGFEDAIYYREQR